MFNLLICDDENYILEALTHNFDWEKYGICVKGTAVNGQAALNQFKTGQFDIALLDIKMPIMSGMELAKEMRKIDQKVQIIFLTSLSEFEYARQAISLNACAYILKPFTKDDILSAVQKALVSLSKADKEGAQEPPEEEASQEGSLIVQKVNEYIESNCNRKLSIKEIADRFGYSTNYLGQLYKKHTGMFVNEYAIKVKMEKAVQLLETPQNSVGDIAEALGYSDIAYFIKQFREYYGVTPKVYRDSSMGL